jgi:hypothetical protein
MKNLVFILLCMISVKGFSQTDEPVVEEKSSAWIKIAATNTVVKPKTTVVQKKKNSTKPAVPKQDSNEDFNKTNQQVNRFKKQKKD